MRALLLTLVVLSLGADETVDNELKKLAGTWAVVVPDDEPNMRPFRVEFVGNKVSVAFNEKDKISITIKVYPTTSPKCIDFALDNGTTLEGIYKFEGETLTFCVGPANLKERPTEFPGKSSPGKSLGRFRRVKE